MPARSTERLWNKSHSDVDNDFRVFLPIDARSQFAEQNNMPAMNLSQLKLSLQAF
jgi:hypothetical protein